MKQKDHPARWREFDVLMDAQDEDLWVIAGNEAADLKGYVRYASGWHITDGLVYLVFPNKNDPAVIMKHGSQSYWAAQKCVIREVHPSLDVTAGLIDLLKTKKHARGRIGVVGLQDVIPFQAGLRLQEAFPGIEFIDETERFLDLLIPSTAEDLRAAEEIQRALEKVFYRFEQELETGKSELEVISQCFQEMAAAGCTDGTCRLSLSPNGANRLATDRRFEKEDIVRLYLEASGPSGYWAELGGVFSFQEPPEPMYRKFETTVKAMKRVAEHMRPGTAAGDLCTISEQCFREDGWDVIGRSIWDAHGQGMCKHVPPYAWPGSLSPLKKNMIINQHTGIITADKYNFSLTNNYLVTENGGTAIGGFIHSWHIV